ncbi:hypothetical protein EYF80_004798 [Liparis tanakae]|uniref:Uncharacterized protein n=1 Tax=Liparis tanakae TaxID=230148 RepID=A0A4Z2J5G1_9TELE|nr:hypothetical protein EYF80_004798 [Liparis tanakae]
MDGFPHARGSACAAASPASSGPLGTVGDATHNLELTFPRCLSAISEAEVSQEVRLLSTGRARGLQLENGCSEGANPLGFEWDFGHTGATRRCNQMDRGGETAPCVEMKRSFEGNTNTRMLSALDAGQAECAGTDATRLQQPDARLEPGGQEVRESLLSYRFVCLAAMTPL